MRSAPIAALTAITLFALPCLAGGDAKGLVDISLSPDHDTWATHDDGKVHGAQTELKVGIERQACDPNDAKNICTKNKTTPFCCAGNATTPAYCAADAGECGKTTPTWSSYRKFRGYLRFDLAKVPKGKVMKAILNLRANEVKSTLGGPPRILTTRLLGIGSSKQCAWDEKQLNSTNLTTWSSLPQNLSLAKDPIWTFDVTKAVADWLTGDADKTGSPVQPNCGFHLHDPDFGKADAPLERWVKFSTKEGQGSPTLLITMAIDNDGDKYTADVDCDDSDKAKNPGVIDVCDGVDNDCSGATDDEVCDGADNDCDGTVDEDAKGQPAPCPTDHVCANHACVKSCKDECGGPTDRKCHFDDTAKQWVVVGCTRPDPLSCWRYKAYEPCNKGQFCNYGSCSFNCVDMCDKKGAVGCEKAKTGLWQTVECGDWDSDGCLENKVLSTCKPGGACSAGTCSGGCDDTCVDIGAVTCAAGKASVCMDSDADGCLDTAKQVACAPNKCAEPLGCALPGSKPSGGEDGGDATGSDAGTTDAGQTETDTATPTDSGDDDSTGPLPTDTTGGGGDAIGASDAMDTSGAADSQGNEADSGKIEDAGATDSSSASDAPGNADTGSGAAATTASKEDGCQAGPVGEPRAVWLVLMLLAMVGWRRASARRDV